ARRGAPEEEGTRAAQADPRRRGAHEPARAAEGRGREGGGPARDPARAAGGASSEEPAAPGAEGRSAPGAGDAERASERGAARRGSNRLLGRVRRGDAAPPRSPRAGRRAEAPAGGAARAI